MGFFMEYNSSKSGICFFFDFETVINFAVLYILLSFLDFLLGGNPP